MVRKYKKVGKSVCPSDLAELIELVNLFPEGSNVPELKYVEYPVLDESGEIIDIDEMPDYSVFPLLFANYLKKRNNEMFMNIKKSGKIYAFFDDVAFREFESIHKELFLIANHHSKNRGIVLNEMALAISNQKGIVEVILSKLLEAINGIDINRIRKCDFCLRVFWAKKINSKTCGQKQCAEILSSKNYRRINKDRINKRRRENYRYKKEMEEKKNGNL